MGPTGPSATIGALLLLFLGRLLLLRHWFTPLPISARPRGRSCPDSRGRGRNVSRAKYRIRGFWRGATPISWGRAGLGLFVRGRRLAMLAALHVLLVERDALLA